MSLSDEFPYDPPGSTDTRDRPIVPVVQSDAWLDGSAVTVDTQFPGARVSEVRVEGSGLIRIRVRPENEPVNNSPWFAFRISAAAPRDVHVELSYGEARHRYVPKLSRDGHTWAPAEDGIYVPDGTNGTAELRLSIGPEPLWVAAQEVVASPEIIAWMTWMERHPFVVRSTYGRSRQGRPLHALKIAASGDHSRWVIVMGRQHPPEVSGALAQMAFMEALAEDTPLARGFRTKFSVLCLPLINPDGVDNGHWRHNAGGVDLNRDWAAFRQPETRQIRDLLLNLRLSGARVLFAIDFHSTQSDVFYTLDHRLPTKPAGFTGRWLARIDETLTDYTPYEESYGLGAPISKNWLYETFGAPSVTYEAGDEVDRENLRRVARASAAAMMELLLEALVHESPEPNRKPPP